MKANWMREVSIKQKNYSESVYFGWFDLLRVNWMANRKKSHRIFYTSVEYCLIDLTSLEAQI